MLDPTLSIFLLLLIYFTGLAMLGVGFYFVAQGLKRRLEVVE